MTSIESTHQTSSASSSQPLNNAASVLGKEDFLALLVAQLQNQDPLNPDDPTEFTAQLAQFSSLEQLFNINNSMNNLVQARTNADQMAMLGTIGKEVTIQQGHFGHTGGTTTLGYQLDAPASMVELAIQQDGRTIAVLQGTERGKGDHYITWDGRMANGSMAPSGEYDLVVSAKTSSQNSVVAKPLVRTLVTGVNLSESGHPGTLVTQSGDITFADIRGIFDR